jgi:methyl-accepting chemotaxis protein
MLSRIRGSYAIKLLLEYAITGVVVTIVGATTGSVAATITMTWAGLLALGSVTGTSTIASVTELRRRTGAIADGELGTQLPSSRDDEFGDLFRAVDTMRRSLSEEIDNATELREEAEQARAEADELAEEYRKIDTATSEQAETVQRTATAVEDAAGTSAEVESIADDVAESIESQRDVVERMREAFADFDRNAGDLAGELRTFDIDGPETDPGASSATAALTDGGNE